MVVEFKESEKLERLKTRFIRYWPGLSCFLVNLDAKYIDPSDKVLVIGSGRISRIPGPNMIRTDIRPFEMVAVVSDAQKLAFASDSFDTVVCHQVLEHVPDSDLVVAEIHRVLKPGGKVIVTVPFYFPFHASPYDFRRWTVPGLGMTFKAFVEMESGMYIGPVSAVLTGIQHFAGIVTPGLYLSYAVQGLLGCLLFPLKYLDRLVAHIPQAIYMAASVFYVGAKPQQQMDDRDDAQTYLGT